MIRINDIIDKVIDNNPDADVAVIDRAYIYSAKVHDGQVRLSGEPYFSHPLEVAGILADMNLDVYSIAAGLLHDVIEDTHSTPEDIKDMFGEEVLHIVAGVTKLSALPYDSKQSRQADSLRKMFLAMADDIRVILIKLADRIHNMRTLQFHKEHKQKQIAQETLDIYAPLASRLGIFWIKNELENISFKYINHVEYEKIKSLVNQDRKETEEYIKTIKDIILEKMKESNIKYKIFGRYKQIYSVYQKMIKQDIDFNDVYDIIAFRLILDTIPQCYVALGLIHSLWKPIPGKFKDYIGVPKPNMYQSLHTSVIGPFNERMEVQIRTHEMDKVAKSGIAAHWSYKEDEKIDEKISKKFAWIQDLIENRDTFKDPSEFLENVRIDLFPEEVYVFTPKGEVKSFPKGSTPVDFAYLVHTEIGDSCVGAKINGRIVPLSYNLQTGNVIEIITSKNHHPSKDWLNFVKTAKARTKIRQWIKIQEKGRSISLGREMCEKAFKKKRLDFNEKIKSEEIKLAVESFGFKSLDDLIANVGYGNITPLQVLNKIMHKSDSEVSSETLFDKIITKVRKKKDQEGIIVNGKNDILVRFGKCCHPVPGDPITGYITIGHGVTIHRANCINSLKMNPERQIDVNWNKGIEDSYPAQIRVEAHDKVGLLADIVAVITKHNSNIVKADTGITNNKTVESLFTITVQSTDKLVKILADIKKLKLVQEAIRVD